MRGLKQQRRAKMLGFDAVASFTDAWIETISGLEYDTGIQVASFTDAWIETL